MKLPTRSSQTHVYTDILPDPVSPPEGKYASPAWNKNDQSVRQRVKRFSLPHARDVAIVTSLTSVLSPVDSCDLNVHSICTHSSHMKT